MRSDTGWFVRSLVLVSVLLVILTGCSSVDSSGILYRDGGRLFVMDADGSTTRALTSAGHIGGQWSDDGHLLYTIEDPADFSRGLTILDAAGETVSQVVVGADWVDWAAWYRDFLIYVVGRPGGMQEIWRFDVEDELRTRLTSNRVDDGAVDVSSSGEIAFISEQEGDVHVFVMYLFGEGTVQVTTEGSWNSNPRWSPDDSMIAFQSDRSGGSHLFVMRADGAQVRQLTRGEREEGFGPGFPRWSPDGSLLMFDWDIDGDWDIFVVHADGSGLANLTNSDWDDTAPMWSPDGTLIAFLSNRNGLNDEIFVMAADGSAVRSTGRSGVLLDWR